MDPETKTSLKSHTKAMPLSWSSRSEVGHVRNHNEDSFLIKPPLFVVADGMGGHQAGEVASTITVTELAKNAPEHANAEELARAIEKTNLTLIERAHAGEGRPGMGTTCTAAMIENNVLAIGHVGDSRAYLLHDGILTRITHDHSFVEELVTSGEITEDEARFHPNRSIITRALGSDPSLYADHFQVTIEKGDRIMLCSDGLSSMLGDTDIESIMVSSPTVETCCDALVESALRAGGHDNVTCIVIDVDNDGQQRKHRQTLAKNIGLWLSGVFFTLVLVGLGINWYASHSWFVIDEGGYVTVYRGIPGTFGPFQLHELENRTTIQTNQLTPSTAKRLKDGVSLSGQEAVDTLLQSYREQIDQREREKVEKQYLPEHNSTTNQLGLQDSPSLNTPEQPQPSRESAQEAVLLNEGVSAHE